MKLPPMDPNEVTLRKADNSGNRKFSRNSLPAQDVPTISKNVDQTTKKGNRLSLPVTLAPKRSGLRYSHSQHYGSPRAHVPPTIPEVEITEEDEIPARTPSVRSQMSRSSSKRNHNHRTSHTVNDSSYENGAYDGPQPDNVSIGKISYDSRSINHSNRSSRNPSVQSLQVQREQYCCASKWSPCERKLVASVTVLATIILILVIVVGYMAGNDERIIDEKFMWSL